MSFQSQQELASQNWEVLLEDRSPESMFVMAEAKTGSRYSVLISQLPYGAARMTGGDHLITVLQPWQTNYPITTYPGEKLHPSYIAEKLLRPGRALEETHGGDFEAICLTINHAITAFHQK